MEKCEGLLWEHQLVLLVVFWLKMLRVFFRVSTMSKRFFCTFLKELCHGDFADFCSKLF